MTVRYTATFLRQLNRLARKYRRIRHDLGTVINQLLKLFSVGGVWVKRLQVIGAS